MKALSSRSHAIIIGGGIAGLLAAKVAVLHFEQVTLVERDVYPEEPVFRAGTPQARHLHSLLLRGQQTLEDLFPGLKDKVIKQGAIERDYGCESVYYYGGRCPVLPPLPQLQGWSCSRVLLEWQVRQEVLSSDRLCLLEGHEVIGLLVEDEAVKGVSIRKRTRDGGHRHLQELHGALVIDASGHDSKMPEWLKAQGYPAPEETVVDAKLGYVSRVYRLSPQEFTWKNIAIQGSGRGGVMTQIEGGNWMVVLAGSGEDAPPTTDEEAYLAFAQSLPDAALYDAIKDAVALSPLYGYRRTENRLRHYERLSRFPEGVLILGDAVCSLNPLYGQGMTVAALEVSLLDTHLRSLRKGKKGFSRRFQQRLRRVLSFPWQLATAADMRVIDEAKPSKKPWLRSYLEHVITLLPSDPHILLAFLEVMHMLHSPLFLFRPTIFSKVIIQMYKTS